MRYTQTVLFEQSRSQSRTVIFRFLISCIVSGTHDALNRNCFSVSISGTVRSVPAGECQRQVLPSTGIVHVIVNTHIVHVAVYRGTSVLLRRSCAGCNGNPVCVMHGHTDNFSCHRGTRHINSIWVMLGKQIFLDGHTAKICCGIRS